MNDNTENDKPRILILLNQLVVGGAELRTLELLKQFEDVKFEIVTIRPDSGPLTDLALQDGHTVSSLRYSVMGSIDLWKRIRAFRPQAVHSQLGVASGIYLLVAAVLRIPVRVAHLRSDGIGGNNTVLRNLKLAVSKLLTRICATSILGVSPGSLEYGWGKGWDSSPKFGVLPNFIDVSRMDEDSDLFAVELEKSRARGDLKIANIGRKDPAKRRGLAIEVWEQYAEQLDSSLFLMGELNKADTEKLNAAVERGALAYHLSYAPNAGGVLRQMDLLITTSEREGLPGVVLEALAAGTPVVASDLPGARWINEQISGVSLVPVDAPVADWVTAMREGTSQDRSLIKSSFAKSQFASASVMSRYRGLWQLNDDLT